MANRPLKSPVPLGSLKPEAPSENRMQFRRQSLREIVEIVPSKNLDDRGYFSEIFRRSKFAAEIGPVELVQQNESLSVSIGTIRGVHFQSHPRAQGKLVRCIAGSVFDVGVDLRYDSPTFGSWVSAILTPGVANQLWIPSGFGHGFCTLEPNSVVSYWVTDYYSPLNDKGVAWNDPHIGIEWPQVANVATLSTKDCAQPTLSQLPKFFSTED